MHRYLELTRIFFFRPIFREIIRDKVKNIVIDCSLDTLAEALKQAQQIGVMGSAFNFLITNLVRPNRRAWGKNIHPGLIFTAS